MPVPAPADGAINPRTRQPYVRGAYKKRQQDANAKAAAAEKKAHKELQAAKASAEKAANDRTEIMRLQSEVARLTEALRGAVESIAGVKKTAMLEASQNAAEQMLQRYRDGLRDGASLTRGGLGGLGNIGTASTPSSAAGHSGSSPSFM